MSNSSVRPKQECFSPAIIVLNYDEKKKLNVNLSVLMNIRLRNNLQYQQRHGTLVGFRKPVVVCVWSTIELGRDTPGRLSNDSVNSVIHVNHVNHSDSRLKNDFQQLSLYELEVQLYCVVDEDALRSSVWRTVIAVDDNNFLYLGPIQNKWSRHVADHAKCMLALTSGPFVQEDDDLRFGAIFFMENISS